MAGLAAIFLPSSLPAQITFERTYGGTDDDYGYSVQQTGDDGFIIAGYTSSSGPGGVDAYLVRTDACGDTLWTKTFGGAYYDECRSVHQTTDGGYIITGYTASLGAGGADVYLIKTNAAGDTLWTKTFGGTDWEEGQSVLQTTDGGYVITGYTYSFGAGGWDVYLIKTDADGDTLWTRTYGGRDDDCGWSVQQTADSGYIIAGYTRSFGAGSYDIYLVRTDARGDTLWTRTLGGAQEDFGRSMQQTSDGGCIVVGSTTSYGAGSADVYLIRTNANGDTLWTKTIGGREGDGASSVQQTFDGGYIIAGGTSSFGEGCDVYLINTDANGDTLWTKAFGGGDGDGTGSVRRTSDGGYIVAGYTYSFGAGGSDVYLIKTDSLGRVVDAVAEPKPGPTRAPALSLSCEPNPCREATRISLKPQASSSKPMTLRVYDAQGRLTRTLTVNRTPYTVWDGENDFGQPLPSGAYFVRLAAGSQHASARLVLQR